MDEEKDDNTADLVAQPVAQGSVRVSRRLEIKREARKKKGKLVKIKLKQRIKNEPESNNSDSETSFLDEVAAINDEEQIGVEQNETPQKSGLKRKKFASDPRDVFDGGDYLPKTLTKNSVGRPRKQRATNKTSSDPNVVIEDVYSLNNKTFSGSTRNRKIFDYESALNEIKEMQERQKTAAIPGGDSDIPIATSNDFPTWSPVKASTSQQPRKTQPNLGFKNSKHSAIQTNPSGNLSSNHYAVLKNNVDLKWANEKLLKENAALKARVDVLLDMLVQKTCQIKLLKMTCVEEKENDPN